MKPVGTHFNDVLFINLDNFLKKVSDKFNDWSKYKSHEYCDHSKLPPKINAIITTKMSKPMRTKRNGIEEAFFFSAFQMIYGTASYGAVPRSTSI